MPVEVMVEDDRWTETGIATLAGSAAAAALMELGLDPAVFLISLLACDDARIAALNADFRGKPQPTNVLSWPSEERAAGTPGGIPEAPVKGTADDPNELGDIAIAYETCEREARDGGKSLPDHLSHLIVHAVLHLCGYDHESDADAELMETIEVRALARVGVADPY
jgi:probable rRNA maturation factor